MFHRFDEVRGALRKLGAPDSTIGWLRSVLPSIAWRIDPAVAQADIADVLKDIKGATDVLRAAVGKSAVSPRHAAALTRIDTTTFDTARPLDGTWPEVVDFAALADLLGRMVDGAVSEAHDQRRGYADLGGAVETLLYAVRRPADEAAVAFAARVRPVAQRSRTNQFAELAGLMFAVASGDPSWERRDLRGAVQAYQASQSRLVSRAPATDKIRKSGRPKT